LHFLAAAKTSSAHAGQLTSSRCSMAQSVRVIL